MKAKRPRPSYLLPSFIGRNETYMTSKLTTPGMTERLESYRKALTRTGKVLILVMLALSDDKRLHASQQAGIATIARIMGHKQQGKKSFAPWIYNQILETGSLLLLPLGVYYWEEAETKKGKAKTQEKTRKVDNKKERILQEFGFFYVGEDGKPVDPQKLHPTQSILTSGRSEAPLYILPVMDANGEPVKNKDGSIRRQKADGITWRWSAFFVKRINNKALTVVFHLEEPAILRRYTDKPASYDLIFLTLFWRSGPIKMKQETLIKHLNIKTKDVKQAEKAIATAFADALKEGIIEEPVEVKTTQDHQHTERGKVQEKQRVYQWKLASKWKSRSKSI